jgi:preprotein translocase subunit Sec61beta
MAKDNRIQMPAGFGGLMRYNEEYESKFNLTPTHVIGIIIAIVLFRIALTLF